MTTEKDELQRRASEASEGGRKKLYRSGSLYGSQHLGDIELRERDSGSDGRSIRSRTPSGKSIKSRTATRAEYHEDLKTVLAQKVNKNLLFHSFIILMCTSFIFGYNIGVLNQPTDLIKAFYDETYTPRGYTENTTQVLLNTAENLTNISKNVNGTSADDDEKGMQTFLLTFLWSFTTTVFVIGGMIGAYAAGFLADRVGRKRACLISLIPGYLGAIISTLCVTLGRPECLMVGRFLTGIHCGFATQLGPMYLLEICPFNLKGAFGTANQLFITIGIFIGAILGLSNIMGTVYGWPYLLLINAVPSSFGLFCLPFLPDSPRYLMIIKHNRKAAEKALKFLRKTSDVLADLEEMETEMSEQNKGLMIENKEEDSYTMSRLIKTRELRRPLFIAMFLNVIQQLSGINAIFFYSKGIYSNAGVDPSHIEYAVVITNFVNVVMTIICVPVMDKAGRRPLLLYPMIAMVFILGAITVSLTTRHLYEWMNFVSIACVLGYVVCFALGLGPIPMMIGGELFRQGPRPRAMSLAGLTNWLFTAIIATSFNLVQEVTQDYVFLIFFFLMIGFTLFVYFFVPETKGKTFEEIASNFLPGGEIEVDEVFEDTPYLQADNFQGGQTEELFRNGGDHMSNNVSSHSDVKIKGLDDEHKSLMNSEEKSRNIPV